MTSERSIRVVLLVAALGLFGYAFLCHYILARSSLASLLADYAFDGDPTFVNFPIVTTIRDLHFQSVGGERAREAIASDPSLAVLPLTIYLDALDQSPRSEERARLMLNVVFCRLNEDVRRSGLKELRPSSRVKDIKRAVNCVPLQLLRAWP